MCWSFAKTPRLVPIARRVVNLFDTGRRSRRSVAYHGNHAVAFPDSSATAEERHDKHGAADDDESQGGQPCGVSGRFVRQFFRFRRIVPGQQAQAQQRQTGKLKHNQELTKSTNKGPLLPFVWSWAISKLLS